MTVTDAELGERNGRPCACGCGELVPLFIVEETYCSSVGLHPLHSVLWITASTPHGGGPDDCGPLCGPLALQT